MPKKKTLAQPRKSGHWPKGKRRNPDSGNWSKTLADLSALLDKHWRHGVITAGALATALGVDRKTIGRWLDGTDRPQPEFQTAIAAWVSRTRKSLTPRGTP